MISLRLCVYRFTELPVCFGFKVSLALQLFEWKQALHFHLNIRNYHFSSLATIVQRIFVA